MLHQNQKNKEDENSCPSCGSPEWKMASLVYTEGISTTRGNTSSSGVGIGTGGVGIGSFKGEYNHFSQSDLSLRASPPAPPGYVMRILACLYGFLFLILYFAFDMPLFFASMFSGFGLIILLPLSMFLSYLYVNYFSDEQEEYEREVSKWSKVKMCLRCGQFFNK